ncbi:hypothetical protein A5673_20375 [Mycobacterium sp. E3198]|nr:hypothetical protein A5673_20375 [Mycobacterium sp. E3198]
MSHLLSKSRSLPATPARDGAPTALSRHRWRIHRGPSAPRRLYPLHEASYLEAELMSRLMQHL